MPPSLLAAFNYIYDAHGVFHEGEGYSATTNLNFVRMEYLLTNGVQHPVMVFGTSRSNALEFNTQLSESTYTFSMLGGVAHYYLLNLATLIDHGIIPEQVVLGLGEDAISVAPKAITEQEIEVRLHPRTTDANPLLYYRDYLWVIPDTDDLVRFYRRLRHASPGTGVADDRSFDFLRTGQFYCFECEERAVQRTDAEHAAVMSRRMQRFVRYKQGERSLQQTRYDARDALDTVKAIVDLADAHEIELFIFTDPVYQDLYLQSDVLAWIEFKRDLAQLTPFLDFSNFDSAFANPRNFIDPVHYDTKTGSLVTQDISNAMRGRVDEVKLGTWITAATAEEQMRAQRERYLALQGRSAP